MHQLPRSLLISLALASLLGISLSSSPAIAQTLEGSIVSVGDGDTIRVKTTDKTLSVRLACIDAPEMAQRPYGAAAASRLKQLLPIGLPVSLKIGGKDVHGRTVAKVFTRSDSINLSLVQDGLAAVYPQYLKECPELRDRLLAAEAQAKQKRLGLWATANPVMPWEFRRSHTTKFKSPQAGNASNSSFDWSKAQHMIDSGKYSSGVNSVDSSNGNFGGSYPTSGSGGTCSSPSDRDSAGRRCGGRAASKRPGGR
jgi:micrococcal nuclease